MSFARLTIYTNRTKRMIDFYETFFGYTVHQKEGDRIVEMTPKEGGLILMLHPLAKSRKEGQKIVKIGFDVKDVKQAHSEFKSKGLTFGPIHDGGGYGFANTSDPAGNSISITDRAKL